MSGLWKPLDHEKSARRDKVQKPDYRESFALPAVQNLPRSPWSNRLIRITAGGEIVRTPVWYREQAREWKEQIKMELRRITNRHPIIVQRKRFAFRWTANEFGVANSLAFNQATKFFGAVQKEAFTRWEMVERRLFRAELHREKQFDPEQQCEIELVELKFGLNDVTQFLQFADGFRIEDEFFSRTDAHSLNSQHEDELHKDQPEQQ